MGVFTAADFGNLLRMGSMKRNLPHLRVGDVVTDLDGKVYRNPMAIGLGGMGRVYKATSGSATYALKFPRSFTNLADTIAEARWTLRCTLPGVVPTLAIGQHQFTGVTGDLAQLLQGRAVPFLVMPYFECGCLGSRKHESLPKSAATCAKWIIQIARACQQLAIVHRDIKPENIFLDAANNAYLADFGLAIPGTPEFRENRGFFMTKDSLFGGTLDYMAPEQYSCERDLGPRTDMFALGMVLYEVGSGRVARQIPSALRNKTDDLMEHLSAHGFGPNLNGFDRFGDPRLRPIIERCTEFVRGKRYPAYDALIQDLEPLLLDATDVR